MENLLAGGNGRHGLQVLPDTVKYTEIDIVVAESDLAEPIVDHLSRHTAVPARFNKASQQSFEQ